MRKIATGIREHDEQVDVIVVEGSKTKDSVRVKVIFTVNYLDNQVE